jgi:23S rRNA (cytosine1962-C5)-methyltransferase
MLPPLLDDLAKLLADDYLFFLLSSHSAGYTPLALTNLVAEICPKSLGEITADEMIVNEKDTGRPLPSGASCFYVRKHSAQ